MPTRCRTGPRRSPTAISSAPVPNWRDGASWRRLLGPLANQRRWRRGFLLGDKRSVPGSSRPSLALGLRMLAQGTPAWGSLVGEDARALFTGVAAHAISRMPSLDVGRRRVDAGHARPCGRAGRFRWVARQAITDALIADLRAHGGELTAGVEVTSPPGHPGVVASSTRHRPRCCGSTATRFRVATLKRCAATNLGRGRQGRLRAQRGHPVVGPAAEAGADPSSRRHPRADGAGRGRHRGRAPCRSGRWCWPPSPHVADPGRIDSQGRRPFWTYAHVPSGSTIDATEAVTGVVERFAPGFRDIVVAARAVPAAGWPTTTPTTSAATSGWAEIQPVRAIAGPTPRLNPWSTPIPKVYLCSAATPPGGGVHGMAGYYAARTLLRREFGITDMPSSA